jgi:uncharacterized protein YkwD
LQSVLSLTNQERQNNGLNPLTESSLLSQAAQKHAENMVLTGIFNHVIGGLGPGDRITAEGYAWQRYGENIAFGYSTASQVVVGWMNSPGHRANILKAEFTEIGLGYALNAQGRAYWVQVFAAPR